MENRDRAKLEEVFGAFLHDGLERISFGNPVHRENVQKVKCRPVFLRGELVFQAEELRGKQAFHKNLTAEEAKKYLTELLNGDFRQCELWADGQWAQILVSKKGTVTIKQKKTERQNPEMAKTSKMSEITEMKIPEKGAVKIRSRTNIETDEIIGERDKEQKRSLSHLLHNRVKRYVLEEGVPVPFLVDLGVMTREGKVVHAKYDKFRQINRFLEFIEDILPRLSAERENMIIDFGCGKSYLTFAMYYYLNEIKQYPIRVIGLDLKKDVIEHCRRLAQKYGFNKLDFCCGDIASFDGTKQADMVVTLHACDTATDFALAKAVNWGAKVILSVPCCQHEWNRQMNNHLMEPVLHYGLLKERLAALYTDGVRAEVLEHLGYRTQILEFIDMEHTPKNILIRAVYQGKRKNNKAELKELLHFWGADPMIVKLLMPELLSP